MGFCSFRGIPGLGCFSRKKPSSPVELVRVTRELLQTIDQWPTPLDGERNDKMAQLMGYIRQMKSILYGSRENEPIPEACSQLTQEFLQDDTMRLCITCLPKLVLEVRKDITQVLANIQRQQVQSRLIACDYLEANKDLLDLLLSGYEDMFIALHYGSILRDCIRHQSIARYVLESDYLEKFFGYMDLPNFEVASDASSTFRELLTRHKSTVSEFLMRNYDWFFEEFNDKLLKSPNYITRRVAIKLLGDILLDKSNTSVMVHYVSSKDNLQVLMNLLREPSKSIQIEAFHVFKVFVANASKPSNIINVLVANRNKLIRFFSDFKSDKEDVQFDEDKAQVVKEIAGLVSNDKNKSLNYMI